MAASLETYVPQHRKRPVYDLGLWLFRRVVWERSMDDDSDDEHAAMMGDSAAAGPLLKSDEHAKTLGTVAAALLLRAVRRDRAGRLADAPQRTALLRDLIHMLLELAHATAGQFDDRSVRRGALGPAPAVDNVPVYERDFEEAFLGESQDFYRVESTSRLSHAGSLGGDASAAAISRTDDNDDDGASKPSAKYSAMEYVRSAQSRLEEERARCVALDLPAQTRASLMRIAETELVERHARTLVEMEGSGFSTTAYEPIYPSDRGEVGAMDDMPAAGTFKALIRWSKLFDLEPAEEADGLDGGNHEEDDNDQEEEGHDETSQWQCAPLLADHPLAIRELLDIVLVAVDHEFDLVVHVHAFPGVLLKVVAGSPAAATNRAGGLESREGTAVVDRDRLRDLAAMHDLFARVPSSLNHLRDALSERIRLDGRALVRDQETNAAPPAAFVKGVLDLRERFAAVVDEAMNGEKKARKRVREAFEDFLNADARAANCLAVYVDELLRTGLRGADERRVSHELDRAIVIFRYLADKDVFEAYYKNHLAKRLLGNKSGSEEAERAMVSLLKAECGYQFTSKLEGMFNDMRISKETAERYRGHKKGLVDPSTDARDAENGGKPVDVEVSVLSNSHWPSQNVRPCLLPGAVRAAMDRFQKYYLATYTGRKLSWQTSTGSAEVRANLPPANGSSKPRRHDLSVTTYQMCILVLFNARDTLTLQQIREATQIPNDELRRHLVSLCTPKHRILRKGSKGKGIAGDDDTFTYNAEYASKMTRVRVPLVSMRDAHGGSAAAAGAAAGEGSAAAAAPAASRGLVDGSAAVPVAVEEDRRHLLEAAVVRIMKARKTLNHNDLVAEVTRQLSGRFVPPPQFVKKRVESLIEREYLERDEGDRRVYRYMA
ncbi:hypothetical protein ACHAXT_005194 [Thalassiosira profunda]